MNVTEEMEHAAAMVLNKRLADGRGLHGVSRDMITAALSHADHGGVKVKALEWKELAVTDREAAVADSVLGKWEVWHFPSGATYIMKPGEYQGAAYDDNYEEAKAYLERTYQRRIAPALTPSARPTLTGEAITLTPLEVWALLYNDPKDVRSKTIMRLAVWLDGMKFTSAATEGK